jgi:hypothetical protein
MYGRFSTIKLAPLLRVLEKPLGPKRGGDLVDI